MQIVPVIDIRNGVVVRAVAGNRANYQPLRSSLATSPAPREVVAGLRARFDFDALYIADLDAIEGRSANGETIALLRAAFHDLRFWVDAGARNIGGVRRLLAHANIDAVIGSESFPDLNALAALRDEPRAILSLDIRGHQFLGAPALLADAALWPHRIIVMTLARVGAGQGPDFERLADIIARAGARRVYAAGGVRGVDDLRRLNDMGVAGALVASALHDGALTGDDIAAQK